MHLCCIPVTCIASIACTSFRPTPVLRRPVLKSAAVLLLLLLMMVMMMIIIIMMMMWLWLRLWLLLLLLLLFGSAKGGLDSGICRRNLGVAQTLSAVPSRGRGKRTCECRRERRRERGLKGGTG